MPFIPMKPKVSISLFSISLLSFSDKAVQSRMVASITRPKAGRKDVKFKLQHYPILWFLDFGLRMYAKKDGMQT